MQAEADAHGAHGLVGVRAGVSNHVWGEHATEFLALGTAVRRIDGTVSSVPVSLTLPLRT